MQAVLLQFQFPDPRKAADIWALKPGFPSLNPDGEIATIL